MRLDAAAFAEFFTAVHGHGPLPWQQDLAERLLAGEDWPAGVDVATGLGKTSLIDIAVFAAAAGAPAARRRTFFVVDRRLVVDEAYDHARTLAAALADPAALDCGDQQRTTVEQVAELLRPDHGAEPLEAARMRGGTTWDWRWVKRPDAPAVVVGTVDQIGSRLLMRGYGLGPHLAPIDAALVGTDSLIVCDEAHLSAPLLQTLNTAVQQDARLAAPVVVTMSATAPPVHRGRVHTTTAADAAHPVAGARLNSPRRLHLAAPKSSRAVAEQMAAWAHGLAQQPGPGRVVLSVCNTVARARAVFTTLGGLGVAEDDRVLLIGRSRPIDRDHLIATAYEHMRLGRDRTRDNTLHVVATQTVEVGANIDADALVSESASYSALVQRLGRVGRAPDIHPAPDFPAVVVHDPTATDEDPVYGPARNATWAWLRTLTDPVAVRKGAHSAQALDGGGISASPLQLAELRRGLSEEEKQAMEAPGSYIPHLWQGTLRLWARTAPRPYPDPPVAPYLHGIDGREADVNLIWRTDLAPEDLPAPGEAAGPQTAGRIAAMPPSAEEMLPLSPAAVRRWAAGADPADLDDVEGARDPETPRPATGQKTVIGLVHRGEDALQAIDLKDVRPGQTVILPARAGGCDAYGWNPSSRSPVTDVADLAHRRDRPRVRVHPRLADLADQATAPAVDALLEAAEEIEKAGEEPEPADFTAALKHLPPAPDVGVLSRSQRLARNLGLIAENDARLIEAGTDQDSDRGRWVLARRGRPFGSDSGTAASSAAPAPMGLEAHQEEVARQAARFAANLGLPEAEVHAVWLAGRYHDEGKRDPRFQAMLYGLPPEAVDGLPALAKSGLDPADARAHRWAARRSTYPPGMRHEALSVAIARTRLQHERWDVDADLVLHLIAAHHGRARPLIPAVADPAPATVAVPGTGTSIRTDDLHDPDQAERFERLQDAHGPWKLALLEAVVRLADIWCSAGDPVTTAPHPHIPRRPTAPPPAPAPEGHRVALPALDGRDPLGFLAALGTLRLLTEEAGLPVRLSFDPLDATAHITGPLPDTETIAHTLAGIAAGVAPDQLLPAMPAGWPPRLHPDGRVGDPLRVDRQGYPLLIGQADRAGEQWLRFITTDLALDNRGRCALTPFMAPAGRQTAATFFSFPLDKIREDPALLDQALTSWQRVDDYTGEYLDHRAIRTAGDLPTGESTPAGVPGATWLATHALPLLHLTGNGTRPQAALWQRIQRRTVMRWPVWHPEHDLATTRALITHPALTRAHFDDTREVLCFPAEGLTPLGIIVMAAAQRIPGRNSAGALAPLETRLT